MNELRNRAGFTRWPADARPGGRARSVRKRWEVRVMSLLAPALLYLACQIQAADAPGLQYEPGALAQDRIQQEWLRRVARETQEQHRLRVVLPHVAPLEVEAVGGAMSVTPQTGAGAERPPVLSLVRHQDLFLGILLCLAVVVAAFKFAPERAYAILTGLKPQALPSASPNLPAKGRTDEQAFAQFLAAFKAGPAAPTHPHPDPNRAPAPEQKEVQSAVVSEPETDPVEAFYDQAPAQVQEARNLLEEIAGAPEESIRQKLLNELYERLCTLRGLAGLAQSLPAWQVASACEWMVKQLADRPAKATASALRTVTDGLTLLRDLSRPGLEGDLCTNPPVRFLAVDDDSISRHAISFSLKKAFNQPDIAGNGEAAMALVNALAYDVIFLDVMMPGMDGFELCSKIRQTPLNRNTPAVFVTCNDNPDARARCAACGGTDLLGKPFLTFEITLKALTLALRSRLAARTPGGRKQPELEPAKAVA